MPVDPSLITDTLSRWQSPQPFTMPDPLAQYAKVQALKNGIMQQQTDALDLQQKQQQIAGQKALDDAITNAYTRSPDGSLELNADAVTNGLAQKGFGHLVPGVLKNFTDMKESAAKAQSADLAAKNAKNDYVANGLATIHDSNYDPHVAIGVLAHAVDTGIVPAQQAAALTAQIQQNPTADGVKQILAPIFAASPGFQERIDKAKTAQAAVDSASARQTNAATGTDRLSDERIERALNAAAGATNQDELNAARNQALKLGASPAQVNAIPMQFSADAMSAYTRSRLTPEQRTTADQRAAAEAATEADRKVAQGQRAQELGISAARLGVERQRFQAETGAQGNQALVNVPLNQRNAALADAVKAGNEAAQAQHAADEMNDLINLARTSGNKIAYAYAPTTGVLTINSANGSKRVNLNEIEAYGGAGSALDKVKEFFGMNATGASIDESKLNDMQQLHGTLAATAQDMYKRKLDVINGTYKSNFAPVPFTASAPAPAPAGAAPAATPQANATPGYTPAPAPRAAPAAVPDWKKAAAAAPIGATIPLPGGKKVLKTGANSFQPIP